MRIAVGSMNPAKVAAVEAVMRRIYGEVEVVGTEVSSGVSEQPLSLDETVIGAVNRAKRALDAEDADFGVGIEAGLVRFPHTLTGYINVQVGAVADSSGNVTVGHGPGFEYPPSVVERVLEGEESGLLIGEMVGDPDVKKKEGAIGFLTGGITSRGELAEMAVLMAMVPRLKERLYFAPDSTV